VSSTLAEQLGRDRAELKVDIRKLKRLGLTISLERGYRISPRGQAVLERLAEDSST
jgi:biotin operon repressor